MQSATRPGVHVDRAACAWLIRRFIDPGAEFVFAADPAAIPAGATPFDMRGAALGHHQAGARSRPPWKRSAWTPTRRWKKSATSSTKPTWPTTATTPPPHRAWTC
jgi:hypothetical protein